MVRRTTLRERIETRIVRKRGEDAFLPREFADLGGEDQVLRVLRGLVCVSAMASMAAPSSRSFPASRCSTARTACPRCWKCEPSLWSRAECRGRSHLVGHTHCPPQKP
jgi:hypothetical protein